MHKPHTSRLIDSRYGLIRQLHRFTHPPELPVGLISFSAEVADTRRFSTFQADRVALGAAFADAEQARLAAIGEAVERYCGNIIPEGLRRASYHALTSAGISAIDPASLVLYAPEQYQQRGFPFVPFTHDLPVRWVVGNDLQTRGETLLPASLVYVNYYTGAYANEPRTNFMIYSGVACGPTRADAERAALEELIERDATMIWWLSGSPALGIDWSAEPRLQAALFTSVPSAIRYHLIQIPTPFALPVIGALIEDTDLQIMALGVACRPDPIAASLKAFVEAIHLRIFAQGLLDPNGHVWEGIRAGVLDARSYQPFRPDRRYRDSFRADFRDVVDLGSQAQIYLDPRMHPYLERIMRPEHYTSLASVPSIRADDLRATYLNRLAERGYRAYSVDLTTPDIRSVGLHVVRVVVPGLYPNAPAAFPFLGGDRLYREPYDLGWIPAPLPMSEIVRVPLPHT
ncbi:MAG: hypothetical protein HC828_00515 [Blastochloris sp.]|nr:hypothetical protein [Blastochloris sp.]